MGLSEASSILWRQRHLLELLLYKLEVEHTLLAAGRVRWLPRATGEVELVLEELRTAELARAVAIDEIAEQLGLASGCTLLEIAAAAPPPWGGIFGEHRAAFLLLTDEIAAMAESNRVLATDGHRAFTDVLADLQLDRSEPLLTAARGGAGRRSTSAGPVLVDEAL
jgi:hypothetical protein